MIIKLTQEISPIWVNTDKIMYITVLPTNNWSRVWLIEIDSPIDVIETPEQIIELIKNA
jgi:hypothetical protein